MKRLSILVLVFLPVFASAAPMPKELEPIEKQFTAGGVFAAIEPAVPRRAPANLPRLFAYFEERFQPRGLGLLDSNGTLNRRSTGSGKNPDPAASDVFLRSVCG